MKTEGYWRLKSRGVSRSERDIFLISAYNITDLDLIYKNFLFLNS